MESIEKPTSQATSKGNYYGIEGIARVFGCSIPTANSIKKNSDKDKAITCRPADLIKPQLADIEKEMAQYKQQDEDVLSYALFPQVATEFFKYRAAQENKIDPAKADVKNGAYPV